MPDDPMLKELQRIRIAVDRILAIIVVLICLALASMCVWFIVDASRSDYSNALKPYGLGRYGGR